MIVNPVSNIVQFPPVFGFHGSKDHHGCGQIAFNGIIKRTNPYCILLSNSVPLVKGLMQSLVNIDDKGIGIASDKHVIVFNTGVVIGKYSGQLSSPDTNKIGIFVLVDITQVNGPRNSPSTSDDAT